MKTIVKSTASKKGRTAMKLPEKMTELIRNYRCNPQDLAISVYEVALKRFGNEAIKGVSRGIKEQKRSTLLNALKEVGSDSTLVHDKPITVINVDTGKEKQLKGLVGEFEIAHEKFQCYLEVMPDTVICQVKQSCKKEAEHFLAAIQKRLSKHSIYRNRAVTIHGEFVDLSCASIEKLVFNEEVILNLRSHLWALIEEPERCAQLGILRRRKVLLIGPPGSGKTQTAFITAKKAIANGWTFLYMPPTDRWGYDMLKRTLEFASFHQPAVVFIEDIDHEQREEDNDTLRRILEGIDGIMSKGVDLILIMTTNRPQNVDAALLRPGRIDHIIRLDLPNEDEIRRIIIGSVDQQFFTSSINWNAVAHACTGFPPAFVREVGIAAGLTMVGHKKTSISQEMLILAAQDLSFQLEKNQKDYGQYL